LDDGKSIEQLEGVAWPAPALQSYVATGSYALRLKPLRALTREDLQLSLEQQVGVAYLVPLAKPLRIGTRSNRDGRSPIRQKFFFQKTSAFFLVCECANA
jgi:hypothetical protein